MRIDKLQLQRVFPISPASRRTILIVALAVGIFFAMQLLCSLVSVLTLNLGNATAEELSTDPELYYRLSLATLVSSVLTIVALILVMRFGFKVSLLKDLDVRHCGWKSFPAVLFVTLAGMIGLNILLEKVPVSDDLAMLSEMSRTTVGMLSIALAGPVMEEVLFRSVIQGSLLRGGFGVWTSILVSAAIFGVIHGNMSQIPFACAIGVLFGMLYAKCRSIIPCIILHIINNGTSVLITNLYPDQDSVTSADLLGGETMSNVTMAVCLVVCVAGYAWFWRKKDNNN